MEARGSPEETRQTLHELRVHQIELEIKNEELRQAQQEFRTSRARYFDLYDPLYDITERNWTCKKLSERT